MRADELYLPRWHDVVEVEPRTLVAAYAAGAKPVMHADQRALDIANVAHAAVGQRRADAATPYIVHPMHVAVLADNWCRNIKLARDESYDIVCAALLHDVVEDTRLSLDDLAALGMSAGVVNYVATLTKIDSAAYEAAPYFEACAQRRVTWIVKTADRVSNLMSAAADVAPGQRNQRWKNYVERTRTEMIPVYERLWPEGATTAERDYLLAHLHAALALVDDALAA